MIGCFAKHKDAKAFDAQALEKAIDAVGRERVFDHARALGWSLANSPPPFVWWGIVNELRTTKAAGEDGG